MYILSSANGKTRAGTGAGTGAGAGAGLNSPRVQENKIPEKTLNKIIENNLKVSNRSPGPYHKSDNLEQGNSHGIPSPLRINKNIIHQNDQFNPLNNDTNITKASKIFIRNQYKSDINVNESPQQAQIGSSNDIENAKPDHFLKFQERISKLLKILNKAPKSSRTTKQAEISHLYPDENQAEKYAKFIDKRISQNRVDHERYINSPDLLRIAITMIDDTGKSTIIMHKIDPQRIQNRLLAKYRRVIIKKEYQDVQSLTLALTKEYHEIVNNIKRRGFKIFAPAGYKATLQDFNDYYRPKLPTEDDDVRFDNDFLEDLIENGIDEHLDTLMLQEEDEEKEEAEIEGSKQNEEADDVGEVVQVMKNSSSGVQDDNIDYYSPHIEEIECEEDNDTEKKDMKEITEVNEENEFDDKNGKLSLIDVLLEAKSIFETADIVLKKLSVKKVKIPVGYNFQNEQDKEMYVQLMSWHDELEQDLFREEKTLNKIYGKPVVVPDENKSD